MAKLGQFRSDTALEAEGVWVEYAAGIEFKIARLNNPAYRKCLRKLLRPEVRRARSKRLDDDRADELTLKAMARHVLVGWKNIENDDGVPIEYSPEKAFEILSAPEYHEIREFIEVTASDADLFASEDREDAEGN